VADKGVEIEDDSFRKAFKAAEQNAISYLAYEAAKANNVNAVEHIKNANVEFFNMGVDRAKKEGENA
jgi:hypothetical protein